MPSSNHQLIRWQHVVGILIAACVMMDLVPMHGGPSFRYTGSDPSFEVWNFGWPLVLSIFDPQSGIHIGPFFFIVVPLQLIVVATIGLIFAFWSRPNQALQRLFLILLVLLPIVCLAGAILLPEECFKAMQKVSNFREIHSDTNLPPAVLARCEAGNSKRRLIWAVTDDKHYVVHQEYVPLGFGHTNYLILVACKPDTNRVEFQILQAGYTRSFTNYQTFVKQMEGPFLGNAF